MAIVGGVRLFLIKAHWCGEVMVVNVLRLAAGL